MKIGDFPLAEALVAQRNHLLGQRDEGRYCLLIDRSDQGPEMAERLKPAIRADIDLRIGDIDSQLLQLGVDPH